MDPDLAMLFAVLRTWLKAAATAAGLTDAQIILANQDGPRPPLPYATVNVLTYDAKLGEDETWVDASDPPQLRQRGVRTGTLSVQTFGRGAATWLRRAVGRLRHPSVLAVTTEAGVTVEPTGGLQNLTNLVDTSMEPRFQRDFSVLYRTVSDPETAIELDTVEVDSTSGPLDDFVVTLT
ncbi:MAG: hypothetical protein AAGA48_27605 [Myxococcota bacterium]